MSLEDFEELLADEPDDERWELSRDKAHVEIIDRGDPDWSGYRIADGLDARLVLPAFGIDVPLREIYADVLG